MKTYSDKEINELIEELQKELPELLKAESLKAPLEGGNGTTPKAASMKKEEQSVSESSSSSSSSEGSMNKDEDPVAKEGSDEASSAGSPAPSSAPDAEGSASAAPAPDAPAPDQVSDQAPEQAPDQAPGHDEQSLEQAYSALSPEDLRAHYEAIKAVIVQQMGGDQSQPPASPAPDASVPAPDAAAPVPPAAPPVDKAMPPNAPPVGKAMPPAPMALSEKAVNVEELAKADKVAELERQIEKLASVLETVLTRPVQKSVTSMTEFMAKSELDKPQVKLSRDEVKAKLSAVARSEDLKKSDRDAIDAYVMNGASFESIKHLLK